MADINMPKRGDPYVELLLERCEHIPQAEKPIFPGQNWEDCAEEVITNFDTVIRTIAEAFNLDIYPNQYKICSSEMMLDAYAHIGMPIMYKHWSFGKQYYQNKQAYAKGQMGLAYEIVINSNPCVSVNMIDNSSAMTFLVMAHAGQGHNSFFKGNYMFREWTDAEGILPYLRFAKDYIDKCYTQIGEEPVRQFLSSCHALQNMAVDKRRRPKASSYQSEAERLVELAKAFEKDFNPVLDSNEKARRQAQNVIERNAKRLRSRIDYSSGGEENLLYVLEKESIAARESDMVAGSPWMVECIRIVRKIAQYFYPQKQTQVMNEGWASFWHHAICTVAYHKGYITTGQYMEIITSHTGVIAQPAYNSPYYSGGLNPYKLGFEMYRDIMFMARGPRTIEEQKKYDEYDYANVFKHHVYRKDGESKPVLGGDWLDVMHFAMRNFRDESFVEEYLSPKICADFGFFAIQDSDENPYYLEVLGNQGNFEIIREKLALQYNLSKNEPQINAMGFDPFGDRTLHLKHLSENGAPLGESAHKVMKHIHVLLRGPKALKSSLDYREFKARLESWDVREPEDPILMNTYPKK